MSLDALKGYNIACVWVKNDENSEKESTFAIQDREESTIVQSQP